jgi:hypothetical protein
MRHPASYIRLSAKRNNLITRDVTRQLETARRLEQRILPAPPGSKVTLKQRNNHFELKSSHLTNLQTCRRPAEPIFTTGFPISLPLINFPVPKLWWCLGAIPRKPPAVANHRQPDSGNGKLSQESTDVLSRNGMHNCLSRCVNTAWNSTACMMIHIACREQEKNVVSRILGTYKTDDVVVSRTVDWGRISDAPCSHSSGLTLFSPKAIATSGLEFASISGSDCLSRSHLSGFSRVGYFSPGLCLLDVEGAGHHCRMLSLSDKAITLSPS